MLLIKVILILTLGLIFYQDLKARMVYWFLFPVLGICSAILFYNNTLPELFYVSVVMNSVFVIILLLAVYTYSKVKLKVSFDSAFGLGDVLLFVGLIFSFSTISFLVVFVFSLLFALTLHLVVKQYSKLETVPLAGYISLFFGISYLFQWTGIINSLYTL